MLAQRALFAERAGERALVDRLLAEAVAAERRMGLPGLIDVLITRGTVFADRGERDTAADALSEALANAVTHGSLVRLARTLEAVSGLVVAVLPGRPVSGWPRLPTSSEIRSVHCHDQASDGASASTCRRPDGRSAKHCMPQRGRQPERRLWTPSSRRVRPCCEMSAACARR